MTKKSRFGTCRVCHANPAMTLDVYARDFAEAARDGELERKLDARGFGT